MESYTISFAILVFCISLSLKLTKILLLHLINDNFMFFFTNLLNQLYLNPSYQRLNQPLVIQKGLNQIMILHSLLIQLAKLNS